MTIESGTRLGPYEIVASIGAGGMGEVWRAKDTRLDREVAIKVLPSGFADNELFLQRFEREAKAISSLNHPHICTLYDIGEVRDEGREARGERDESESPSSLDPRPSTLTRYLVMELIEGESLADRLKKGPLPLHEVLKVGRQISSALDAAHRQGVIHRDLKPGNIMLTRSGAKLLDFGLAKTATEGSPVEGLTSLPTEAKPLTQEGTILGTFQYMAPEQLEGIEADARTDIFALGAVIYEMATGRRAFLGESKTSLIAAIVSAQPEPISQITPMTPPALDHVVRKCLEKDPDDRWQSAHDVASEMQWISEAGSQAGVATAITIRRKTRERLAWSVAAIVTAALVLLAISYFRLAGTEVPSLRTHLLPPESLQFQFTGINCGGFALSPDGRNLAFTAVDGDGERMLWVRPLDSLDARLLNGTKDAHHPFWSPDGKFIAFFADNKLKKVDISGTPPLVLCDASNGRSGSWSEDGTIIFSPTTTTGIHRVSASGGEPEPVTTIDGTAGETTHRWATFLPNGNNFLFMSGSHALGTKSESNAIWAGALDSPDRKHVLTARSNITYASGHLLYVQDGVLIAQRFDPKMLELEGDPVAIDEPIRYTPGFFRGHFSVSANGMLVYQKGSATSETRLIWTDRSGEEIGSLNKKAEYQEVSLSPDESKLAVVIANPDTGNSDIWIYEIEREVMTRFTFGESNETNPVWSPDGRRIAFAQSLLAETGLRRDIHVKDVSGGGTEDVLLASEGNKRPNSWSKDGRFIAFENTFDDQQDDIWILPVEGDRDPYPFLESEFDESQPAFSPDGRWMSFLSNESGRLELYVVPFPGPGGKWQVSTAGSFGGGIIEDEIVWLASDATLMSTPWSAEGNDFRLGSSTELFRRLDIQTGDIPENGERFILAAGEQGNTEPPLTLVTNWMDVLKE